MTKAINKFKVSNTGTRKKRTLLKDRCRKHISDYSDLNFGKVFVMSDGRPIVGQLQQKAIIVYHPINKKTREVDNTRVYIGVDLNVNDVNSIFHVVASLIKESGVKVSLLLSLDASVIQQYYSANNTVDKTRTSGALQLFRKVIVEAMRKNASDIDMSIVYGQTTSIMMSIDGIKRTAPCPFDQKLGGEIVQAMIQDTDTKLSHLNIASPTGFEPVDFSYVAMIEGCKVLLRCNLKSTFNHHLSLSMRMSVFNPSIKAQSLVQLGYSQAVSDRLAQLMMRTSGLFLITGITGSGKTTTASSLWSRYMRENYVQSMGYTKTLLCLDDPTETEIPGAYHFELASDAKISREDESSNYISAFLRSNPDAISIGEIRDASMLSTTMEAARTGHICGSTMHVSSWYSIFSRIQEDFNVSSRSIILNDLLLFVITQKLLSKICPDCHLNAAKALSNGSIKNDQVKSVNAFFGENNKHKYVYTNTRGASDCQRCGASGVSGRLMAYEFFEFDRRNEDVIKLLMDYKLADAYRLWSDKESNGLDGEPLGNMIYRYFKKGLLDSFLAYNLLHEHMPSKSIIESEGLNYAVC